MKQLAQNNPAAATSVELYAPASGLGARNLRIFVCETGGADSVFTIYHDVDGAVRDETTAIIEGTVPANSYVELPLRIEMSNTNHGLGVVSVTGDVNFTLYGEEFVA